MRAHLVKAGKRTANRENRSRPRTKTNKRTTIIIVFGTNYWIKTSLTLIIRYKNLCKAGQLASGGETDLELLAMTKMGLQLPESPLPKTSPGIHTDEEIADGFTVMSTLLYCSSEAIELFKFYNETIVLHSPATVLQATMNNLSPGLLTDHLNIEAVHRLYGSLEKRFGFNLGPIVAGLTSTRELATLLDRGDPLVQSMSANLSRLIKRNLSET